MLVKWVKSGLLFGVLASVILLICPNKSYTKHISMVIGLLYILIMIHPVMEFLHLDTQSYVDYMNNLLLVEGKQSEYSKRDIRLYEEMLEKQIYAVFNENESLVAYVSVDMNDKGEVEEITIKMSDEGINNKQCITEELTYMFGEEVYIRYE
ncbi:MAG: stage III sporulation protein AF [Eubacteriales bacterium]|nr:stage III sporulation protein AF [Eubacteriales bacterium]